MSAHTKGPWSIGARGEIQRGSVDVAQVIRTSSNFDEARANARLIAAAPDLLEVATYAKAIQADVFRGAIDPVTALDAIVDLADAAIAKATAA